MHMYNFEIETELFIWCPSFEQNIDDLYIDYEDSDDEDEDDDFDIESEVGYA
jgi:hypothetical protein